MESARHVLIRYHEIALKGRNRSMFVDRLVGNIRRATVGMHVASVWSERMGVHVDLEPQADWSQIRDRVSTVFGAVKLALAYETEPNETAITSKLIHLAREIHFGTFRITTNRSDKRFPLTSQQLNIRLGELVQKETKSKVNLQVPDVNFRIEIGTRKAYIYTQDVLGAGGLPVGTAGRVSVLMSGGIDSPVAAWRLMRRGCHASLVHFHSFPLVEGRSREKAKDLARILNNYQYDTKLYLVPFAEIQKNVILSVPGPLRVVAYRRFMIRIAEKIGLRDGSKALVTGESVGQVGSQTLQNIATVGQAANMPLLRPLVGMDKQEIVNESRLIGTYDTSILPDEDCCTLFVPKSPSTSVSLESILRCEQQMDIDQMLTAALSDTELVEYRDAYATNGLSGV